MPQESLKYPNRADALALLRARELGKQPTAMALRSSAAQNTNANEAPVCIVVPPQMTH
jgi:hypothetical protein